MPNNENCNINVTEWADKAHSVTFSVIIPAFNASRYIERCINSVKSQSFTNFECIIVNDGSTDDTLALCRHLTKDDARFILIDSPNGGVSSARNKGLERVSGEYVLFVDADDWVEPSWLNEISQHSNGADIVQYDFYKVSATKRKEIHIDSDFNLIVQGEGAVVWKRAYKRSLVANLRFDTQTKAGEDYLFNVQAFLRCQSYRHIDSCLYNYNTANEQSAMHTHFAENFGQQLLVTGKVEQLLKSNGIYEVHEKNLRKRYYWCLREICSRWLLQNMKPGLRRRLALSRVKHLLKKGL